MSRQECTACGGHCEVDDHTCHDARFTRPKAAPLETKMEPEVAIMKFFAYSHLPPRLQAISEPFAVLARLLVDSIPDCAERSVALRKLLEGKDAAVRAAL